jgi:hypothetical protein
MGQAPLAVEQTRMIRLSRSVKMERSVQSMKNVEKSSITLKRRHAVTDGLIMLLLTVHGQDVALGKRMMPGTTYVVAMGT